ncbi:J domain-containing protein [Halomonas salifodinae]|uniref:J domain-containing protein n=1 Tax=Halomonas salifodinae TaxID=438745 RepID=UPI0033AD6375
MSIARFTPFERLLLTSRHQADTAALLLLGWVLVNQGPVGEDQRARLVSLTRDFRHGHDLAPLLEIAAAQDLDAIQLAAEVLQREARGGYPFLRLAIALAAGQGEPSPANHHVLRFLADLLGVPPQEFAALYEATSQRPLQEPADPSRHAYWQPRFEERARREEARRQAEEQERQREEESRKREEGRQQRETRGEQQRRESRDNDRRREEQQRQREEQRRRESRDNDRRREEQQRQERQHYQPPPGGRQGRALQVLGLSDGASRQEIRRAYRRLAQAHHPDRFHAEGEAVMASASRRFQRIKQAYDYLMREVS